MKRLDTVLQIFLFSTLVIGVIAIVRLRYDAISQFLVILLLALFYILWGSLYHHIKGDISKKLFLEYLLVALIASGTAFLVFVR